MYQEELSLQLVVYTVRAYVRKGGIELCVHTCSPSTREGEAGRLLGRKPWPTLVGPDLKTKQEKENTSA